MSSTLRNAGLPAPARHAMAHTRTLAEMFHTRVEQTPGSVAYLQHDSGTGEWAGWTWRRTSEEASRWRLALAKEQLVPGSRVATLMASSVSYVCADQAALSLGLAIVPMHTTDNPGNLAYILQDSDASALIIDNPAYWARLAPEVRDLAGLKRIVVITDGEPGGDGPIEADARAMRASQWLGTGEARETPGASVAPETLAAIVYTSGTTGRPKGVMLSHGNVVSDVLGVLERIEAAPNDLYLSFLPLSHTLERTAGYYLPIAAGSTVAFARSAALLSEDLHTIRPTILISVPRIYERAHLRIHETLAEQGGLAQTLSRLTGRVGWRRFLASQAGAPNRLPLPDRLAWLALDKLVAARIRAQFGGRLRIAVAGGAPMPVAVSRYFLSMGVNVLQGYGMTEASPVVSVNRIEYNDPESAGEAIAGVELRIGGNDELLVKGPNVMQGYWRRPEETRQVLEPDGWLHTGDQARLHDGRVFIKGRIKDIIVTSTGEKISPADLEEAISGDPLFEQVIVIGEQRPFVAAIAVLNRARFEDEARALGFTGALEDILASDQIRALALARIKRAAAHFPAYAMPRKVWLTLEPWTVAAGLMTPTLKPKRKAIEGAFADQIASFYTK
ncbi:MAG: AMP-dependent synthetase/ligase [Rhodomicrobium sp.]